MSEQLKPCPFCFPDEREKRPLDFTGYSVKPKAVKQLTIPLPTDQERRFARWLKDNQSVWQEFSRRADALRETGAKRGSAMLIMEEMRRDGVNSTDPKYRINNNYRSGLARKYNDAAGFEFFRIRGAS